jgi:hypothetical protein
VHRITDAPVPLAEDLARRTRRYLVQMSIRVACFVGAVVVDHWTRWLLLAGAVVLPYVAVVLANGGRERGETEPEAFVRPARLPGTQHPTDDAPPGRAQHDEEHR